MPEGCAAIQTDLDTLEKWADMNLMEFNKQKCEVHLRRNNPMHQYMLGDNWLQGSFVQKTSGVLVDTKLNMRQATCPCSKEGASDILGCIKSSLSTGEAPPGVCCVQAGPSRDRESQTYWRKLSEGPWSIWGLDTPLVWGKAEKAESVQPGEKKAWGGESYPCVQIPNGKVQKTTAFGYLAKGEETMGTNWNTGNSV